MARLIIETDDKWTREKIRLAIDTEIYLLKKAIAGEDQITSVRFFRTLQNILLTFFSQFRLQLTQPALLSNISILCPYLPVTLGFMRKEKSWNN